MADNKDKKGNEIKSVMKYLKENDRAEFKELWKNIRINDYDLDLKDENGKTALMELVSSNDTDKAWILLEFFADPNIEGPDDKTALHFAVEENKKEYQFVLMLFGADPDKPDKEGNGPFSGKEDERDKLKEIVDKYKKTFLLLTRKRRKYLRYIFNKMGGAETKQINPSGIIDFYMEVYKEQISQEDAMKDSNIFMENCLKHKLDPTEKDSLYFEDFFIAMLKIAHVKGLKRLDEFINVYKRAHEEEKRKLKEEDIAKKNKENAA